MKYPETSVRDSRRVLTGLDPAPGCFAANQFHALIADKVIEHSHGVAAAAHTGDHRVRKLSLSLEDLLPGFP